MPPKKKAKTKQRRPIQMKTKCPKCGRLVAMLFGSDGKKCCSACWRRRQKAAPPTRPVLYAACADDPTLPGDLVAVAESIGTSVNRLLTDAARCVVDRKAALVETGHTKLSGLLRSKGA